MFCLGNASHVPALPWDSQAAQLWIVEAFRANFLSRFKTGIVLSEYEYMGRTTFASASPTPLRVPGSPRLTMVLDALAHDFRRWNKERDYRKCDVLGIANDGLYAELIEVTTENNALSAITQLHSKIAILRETVNSIHELSTDWQPSKWKPEPNQMFRILYADLREIRYICYMPTIRTAAPNGIILYEVHRILRNPSPLPIPAPEKAGEYFQKVKPFKLLKPLSIEERARVFLTEHPDIAFWIKGLALVMSIAAAIAAIIALIDPVPGDEVAALAFAGALFRIATK